MFVNLYDELNKLAAEQEEESCCSKCGVPISHVMLYGCLRKDCGLFPKTFCTNLDAKLVKSHL